MTTYPSLSFKISETKDLQTFLAFVDEAEYSGGQTLKWAITETHPFFEKFWEGNALVVKERVVSDFIAKKYCEQIDEMRSSLNKAETAWKDVRDEYFILVADIFENHKWPAGKYFVYPTIWGMYPRFLKDKTFQIPFKGKSEEFVTMTIAHEMLHFIFYDYLFTKKPELDTEDNQMLVWHTSEIFNVVVQNSKKWLNVFKEKTPGYPNHENVAKQVSEEYQDVTSNNVDEVIKMILEKVSGSGDLIV